MLTRESLERGNTGYPSAAGLAVGFAGTTTAFLAVRRLERGRRLQDD